MPTGVVRPTSERVARRSRLGQFACSSSLRLVSVRGNPPSPSSTQRMILVLLGRARRLASARSTTFHLTGRRSWWRRWDAFGRKVVHELVPVADAYGELRCLDLPQPWHHPDADRVPQVELNRLSPNRGEPDVPAEVGADPDPAPD